LETGGLLPPDPSDDADRTPGRAFCAQPVISDAAMAATASIPLELPLHRCSLQSIPIDWYRFIFNSRQRFAYASTYRSKRVYQCARK